MANLQIYCIDEARPQGEPLIFRLSSNGHVFFRRTVHVARPFPSSPLKNNGTRTDPCTFCGQAGLCLRRRQ